MKGQTVGLVVRDPDKRLFHELKAALAQPAAPLFVKAQAMNKKFIFQHQHRIKQAGDCPDCLRRIEAASAADGTNRVPSPGDFSICVHCGAILRYEDDMQLRRVDDDDEKDMPPEAWDKMREASQIFKQEARRVGGPKFAVLPLPKIE